MPYFKNNDVNIIFIHIPKTGGTSIEEYFSARFNIPFNNKSLFGFIDNETKSRENMIINSTLQHITYKQMIKYNKVFNIDFHNSKIITVVRNPYERIISDFFFHSLINVNTTKKEVFNLMQKYLVSNNYDNHNLPQYSFIIDYTGKIRSNIHVLHTETLTNDMKKLGYTDFDGVIYKNKSNVNYYDYLNKKSIQIINRFYHFDFILFNYNKLPTKMKIHRKINN